MPRGIKTALTLAVLAALVVVGGMWGWAAFTEPFPDRAGPAPCTTTTFEAGESLTPDKLLVSVYNASDRVGLAGRTADELASQGFVIDETSDAPTGTNVEVAEVWVADPQAPDALLVRSYLGKRAGLVAVEPLGPGITVVVGPKFTQVGKGKKSLQVTEDTTVCVPPPQG